MRSIKKGDNGTIAKGSERSQNMKSKMKKFHLKIPGRLENLGRIRNFISGIAVGMGFGKDDINKIELAIDEACTNVIKHAYRDMPNGDIDINVNSDDDKLAIKVTDYGKSFNHETIQMPDMEKYLAELRVGGLGIYLMKTLMDEVDYKVGPGKMNNVIMVKYLPGRNN